MLDFFQGAQYDFIGKRRWAYLASLVMVLVSLVSLGVSGLRYDLDFTGGLLIQIRFERPPDIAVIRAQLAKVDLGDAVIQEFGDPHEYILRARPTGSTDDTLRQIETTLAAGSLLGPFEIRRAEFVGPQVGRELQWQAVYAVAAGLVGILAYLAFRFDLKGGIAAIIAVGHDVLVCLGAITLTGREFSLAVLAAMLTVIGYSVNDTIVAYDRLRENLGKRAPKSVPFSEQMNQAINQTLSRTVLTSLTTLLPALTLLVFGGKALEDFAFVVSVGIVFGTYSTIYIAGALIVDWTQFVEARRPVSRRRVVDAP